jgi:hypothetical protein
VLLSLCHYEGETVFLLSCIALIGSDEQLHKAVFGFFFFGFEEALSSRKVYFVGPGEGVNSGCSRLLQELSLD